eukprot:contig_44883_g9962
MRTYDDDDLVLARLDGYPWWPAMVVANPPAETIASAKAGKMPFTINPGGAWVRFFGEGTYSAMTGDNLKPLKASAARRLVERETGPGRQELAEAFVEASQYLVDAGRK